MSNYFNLVPDFEYVSRLPDAKISDYITVKNLFKRVNEIYNIAELLNKKNTENINFSNLLFEITKRTLNENKFESNLFFL